MLQHYTASTYLVFNKSIALHWHKLNMWLPPGGHLLNGEEPSFAAIREVKEETGIDVKIIDIYKKIDRYKIKTMAPSPISIKIYEVSRNLFHPKHTHIDFIYFAKPEFPNKKLFEYSSKKFHWFNLDAVKKNKGFEVNGEKQKISKDVRALSIAAILALE
ncbi:MAG: 8-oxo-dGTP pyrophosphatase MutT, NUDIX family [Chloroflexi bacterium]|jgi:8-oxo-dGTP pyrophosphatase MutT (NUDIX family)|nr:MAG: 8-oxo-dGTP pyrophosphatase MutT, NUDIX family [Chloroflexota bacterium]|tara:strand:- start:2320 stop:2799 length:480 start_codon:yes stop_codon:yes gene_type:complete